MEFECNHEELMWKVIEFVDWVNIPPGSRRYREVGAQMKCLFKESVLKLARDFARDRVRKLMAILEDHAEAQCGNRHGYYGLSDDSFWDLTAHVVGLGQKFYNSVVANPEIAKRMADGRSFSENFEYTFQYALSEEKKALGGEERPTTPE